MTQNIAFPITELKVIEIWTNEREESNEKQLLHVKKKMAVCAVYTFIFCCIQQEQQSQASQFLVAENLFFFYCMI